MSDDRFTYIHLRSETSLWCYADDQVDWALEDLEDRVDQSAWDMIPPYQNEDDEGILPSHSHPSYPFGNPYDPSQTPVQAPQLARVINQPLAVGSALLLPSASAEPGQAYWAELATDRLLRPSGPPEPLDDLHPDDLPPDQLDLPHHHRSTDPRHLVPPPNISPNLATPNPNSYRPPPSAQTAADQTEFFGSEEDDEQSGETGAMVE
ncbi:hypothetical protein PtA15_4A644 [Puccinia triticina]|uniref:Anaphase-promoting complex subunit 13 n=1 Tax=Puccinia triticina TaxID=208348 RepID=A0ABY7CN20_9BASI|nr:uncharacterized protein PtA15_4A644 [Puccinia triticina]WAQ84192.1 hypothetical protein PtA15_4A644 [Puccinia triticina]WAR55024.1 hypothetical protein PtB15_4B642 [Puccinia triticina]